MNILSILPDNEKPAESMVSGHARDFVTYDNRTLVVHRQSHDVGTVLEAEFGKCADLASQKLTKRENVFDL